MKKIYQQPTLEVFVVETMPLLEESLNMQGSKGDYSGGQLSRESDWED